MADNKNPTSLPDAGPAPEPQRGEGEQKGGFSDVPLNLPVNRGYQTPQDQKEHWNGPTPEKDTG